MTKCDGDLSDQELLRYSRHLLLPELGLEAQQNWRSSRVTMIGCGGLGHPAALYLASSGIGELHLVDPDLVELSNLQRQICFTSDDLGKPKAQLLAEALHRLNPHVQLSYDLQAVTEPLTKTLSEQLQSSQLLFDCTDNFQTRYLLNRLSLRFGVPLVSAAATQFSGVAGLFNAGHESPCYSCLFQEADEPESRQTCAETGVFAPLLGIMGAYQASLGLQYLANYQAHDVTQTSLLTWDIVQMKVKQCVLTKDPECPCCSHRSF